METKEINTESVIKKIKALLAKGQSTDNLHEKSIFIAKAHKMMAEYNITLTEDKDEEVYTQKVGEGTQTVSTMRKTMANALAKHYGCRFYFTESREFDSLQQKYRKMQRMVFVGTQLTVDTFIMTFDFCWESFIKMSNDLLKAECEGWDRGAKIQFKEDYLVGFCDGIVNELIKSVNQFGLVVTVPEKVDIHIATVCRGGGRVTTKDLARSVKNGGAVKRGYLDGSFAMSNKDKAISSPA